MVKTAASLIICLILGARTAWAAGDCATQDWLVQAFHQAQRFDQQRDQPGAAASAQNLLRTLDRFSMDEVAPLLRASGLARHTAQVQDFLRSQRSLATAQIHFGTTRSLSLDLTQRIQKNSEQMQRFVGDMRCDSDTGWSPSSPGFTQGRTTPVPLDPGASSLPRRSIPRRWQLGGLAVGLALFGLGMALYRRGRQQTRRAYKFPCALRCQITDTHFARTGTINDISQLGAKIHLGGTAPQTLKTCTLHSHGWSAQGRIAWRNAQYIGIAFKHPVPHLTLRRLLRLNRQLHAQSEAPNEKRHPEGAAIRHPSGTEDQDASVMNFTASPKV